MTPSSDAAIALAIEQLRAGREVSIVNVSESLWPLVRPGDTLVLRPGAGFGVGSLVAVVRAGRLVVHRVLSIDGALVRLKGDANANEDAPVLRHEILATAVGQVLRSGRRVGLATAPLKLAGRLVAAASEASGRPWRWLRTAARARRRLLDQ